MSRVLETNVTQGQKVERKYNEIHGTRLALAELILGRLR